MRTRHRFPKPVYTGAIFTFGPVDDLSLLAQAREKCAGGVRKPSGRTANGIKGHAVIACEKVLDHRGLGLLFGWNADGDCDVIRRASPFGMFRFGRAGHATRLTSDGLSFHLISHQVILHYRSSTLLLPPPEALPASPVRAAAPFLGRDSHEDQCSRFRGSPMETALREKLRLGFPPVVGRGPHYGRRYSRADSASLHAGRDNHGGRERFSSHDRCKGPDSDAVRTCRTGIGCRQDFRLGRCRKSLELRQLGWTIRNGRY